jgi:hypothetical protein
MDNSASNPAAAMAGIFLLVTFIIGFGGFLWSLIVSCKRGSVAGIIMSFIFWPIGLLVAYCCAPKDITVNVTTNNVAKE